VFKMVLEASDTFKMVREASDKFKTGMERFQALVEISGTFQKVLSRF